VDEDKRGLSQNQYTTINVNIEIIIEVVISTDTGINENNPIFRLKKNLKKKLF